MKTKEPKKQSDPAGARRRRHKAHRGHGGIWADCVECNPLADEKAFLLAVKEPLDAVIPVAHAASTDTYRSGARSHALPVTHPWLELRDEIKRRLQAQDPLGPLEARARGKACFSMILEGARYCVRCECGPYPKTELSFTRGGPLCERCAKTDPKAVTEASVISVGVRQVKSEDGISCSSCRGEAGGMAETAIELGALGVVRLCRDCMGALDGALTTHFGNGKRNDHHGD